MTDVKPAMVIAMCAALVSGGCWTRAEWEI
jgi:hypothetical protein